MNPNADLTHIVLKVRSFEQARIFYCDILGLTNRSMESEFLSFEIGSFFLNFAQDPNYTDSWALGIGHIGLQFPTRASVDTWHSRLVVPANGINVSKITGGPGKGPYRFYLKDPHGYTFEFESWEGCSD